MGINDNAKKLSSLSKTAIKGITGSSPRAWFLIEQGKTSLFYVDKKLSSADKLKDPVKCKVLLTKLKVEGVEDIDAKSPLVCGVVARKGEGFAMAISYKKNGAGKSTLKSAIKDATVKKLLPNVEIVKSLELGDTSERAENESIRDTESAREMEENNVSSSHAKAFKIFTWWRDEGGAILDRISATGVQNDEDFLQTALRRLTKFKKKKMYDLFEPHFFGMKNGPLERFKYKDFDLTKDGVTAHLTTIEGFLNGILDGQAAPSEDDIAEMEDLLDDDIVEEMTQLEEFAKTLKLSDSDTIDFLSDAHSYARTVGNLIEWFSPADVKALCQGLGDNDWSVFLAKAALTDTQIKSAVKMCGGKVSKFLDRMQRAKDIHFIEFLFLCEAGAWDWDTAKPLVKERVKEEQNKPKVTKTTITLFQNDNLARVLSNLPFTPILRNDISIQVDIRLKANTPEELDYGLDNAYIAQRIHDAGDYKRLVRNVSTAFQIICSNHEYYVLDPEEEQTRKLELITRDLKSVLETEQEAAAARAEACAKEEFGLDANITSKRRWQAAGIAFSVIKVGIGVFALAAATTVTLGASILAAHGLAKSLISTGIECYSCCSGFQENMRMLEADVNDIRNRVNTLGTDGANIASRMGETFLGDLVQPWNRVKEYSKNAKLRLDEMRLKAQRMSVDLQELLSLGATFTQRIQTLKDNIATLESDPDTNPEWLQILKRDAARLEANLTGHEATVNGSVDGASEFGGFIDTCETRFVHIIKTLKKFDPSKGAEAFMAVWGVLEFAGGIIAGGAAEDANILKGLNPINDKNWVTAANFANYVNTLSDAKDLVITMKETIYDKK